MAKVLALEYKPARGNDWYCARSRHGSVLFRNQEHTLEQTISADVPSCTSGTAWNGNDEYLYRLLK